MIYLYLNTRKSFYDIFEDTLKREHMFENGKFINSNVIDIFILSELSFIRAIETFVNFFVEKDIKEEDLENYFFSNYDVESIFLAFLDLFLNNKIYIKKIIRDINVVSYKQENKVYYDWGVHQGLIEAYVQMLDRRYAVDKTYSKNFLRSRFFISDIVLESTKSNYDNAKIKVLLLLMCLYNIKSLYSLNVLDTIITYDLIADVKQYFLDKILAKNKYKFRKIYDNINNNFKKVFEKDKIHEYIENFKTEIGILQYIL